MKRLLPPVDSAFGGGKEQREVGGRGEAETREVWEIGGGVRVNLVSFVRVPVCVCWRGRESWERGGGAAEGISWSANL